VPKKHPSSATSRELVVAQRRRVVDSAWESAREVLFEGGVSLAKDPDDPQRVRVPDWLCATHAMELLPHFGRHSLHLHDAAPCEDEPGTSDGDGWLTIQQAARLAACSASTIRRRIADGSLQVAGKGRLKRIRRADLRNWIERADSSERTAGGAEPETSTAARSESDVVVSAEALRILRSVRHG